MKVYLLSLPYLVIFMMSAFLLYVAERIKNPIVKKVIVFFSLMFPIMLAAIRSPEIGTDVKYYAIPHYSQALGCKTFSVFAHRFELSFTSEPLYAMILFITTRLTRNYHAALFVFQAITVGFTYLGFKRLKKQFDVPIWLGMTLYYLMYYNVSLNILRQSMAVAVVFYATTFLMDKQTLKYFFFMLIAFFLHSSAVIGFAFLPMYLMLKKTNNGLKFKDIRRIALFLVALMATVVLLDKVVRIAVSLGVLKASALNYLSDGRFGSSYLSVVSVFVYTVLICAYVVHTQVLYHKKIEPNFFMMVSVVMFVCSFGSLISVYISRVCYYFIPFQAFALASVQNCYKKSSRLIWYTLVILFVLATWFIFFVIKNNHMTCPYMIDPELFA